MANYGQVCVLIWAPTQLSSVGVLFLLNCVNFVIYIYKLVLDVILTDFFLEFIASLYDFLHNSTVTVMLVFDYACLSLLPVICQLSYNLRLDLIDFQFNVFLASFKLWVQIVSVVHQQYKFITQWLLILFFTHVSNTFDLCKRIRLECFGE